MRGVRRPPTPAELARAQCGLTLAAVARYLRTSEGALRRLERAGRGWSYDRAVKLARLYGCSLEAFPPGGRMGRGQGSRCPVPGAQRDGDGRRCRAPLSEPGTGHRAPGTGAKRP